MTRNVWVAMAIACATTIAVGAQSGSATTSKSADDKNNVTVTGCLQDSSKSASTSTTSGGYILANAMTSGSMSNSTTGTTAGTTATGTTGATADRTMPAGKGSSYVLEGRDGDLKNHEGHRIEVTGTVESHDNMKSSTATSTTTSGSASSTTESAPQRLKVSSIRMIAPDCSAK